MRVFDARLCKLLQQTRKEIDNKYLRRNRRCMCEEDGQYADVIAFELLFELVDRQSCEGCLAYKLEQYSSLRSLE